MLAALNRAIDLGVNFIDTAAGYGNGRSEQIIALALRDRPEKIFVATKTPPTPGKWPPSPYCRWEDRYPESYLRENIDQRRRMLGVDRLDLLQLHTWTGRERASRPARHAQKAPVRRDRQVHRHFHARTRPEQRRRVIRRGYLDAVQVIFNIFQQEPAAELLPAAQECNVGVIGRVPFDEGSLTGKYRRGRQFPPEDFRSKYFAGDRLDRTVNRVEKNCGPTWSGCLAQKGTVPFSPSENWDSPPSENRDSPRHIRWPKWP